MGWLVAQCDTPPLVVPFVHSGMEKVTPKGAKLPRAGEGGEEGWQDSVHC